jgi:hypothetical protein
MRIDEEIWFRSESHYNLRIFWFSKNLLSCSDCEAILQGFNDLQKSSCSDYEADLKKFNQSTRKTTIKSFSLELQSSEMNCLISKQMIWSCRFTRKKTSCQFYYLAKSIDRFVTKRDVSKACFFVNWLLSFWSVSSEKDWSVSIHRPTVVVRLSINIVSMLLIDGINVIRLIKLSSEWSIWRVQGSSASRVSVSEHVVNQWIDSSRRKQWK